MPQNKQLLNKNIILFCTTKVRSPQAGTSITPIACMCSLYNPCSSQERHLPADSPPQTSPSTESRVQTPSIPTPSPSAPQPLLGHGLCLCLPPTAQVSPCDHCPLFLQPSAPDCLTHGSICDLTVSTQTRLPFWKARSARDTNGLHQRVCTLGHLACVR